MGSWAEPTAYAGRAAWCGPRNARGELLCGRVLLTTVGRSLHGGPLMARADTIRATLPPGASATRNAKTACSAAGRSGTVRTEAMPQHRDAWTMVWQTQVTDALGHLL